MSHSAIKSEQLKNWGGNVIYSAARVHYPKRVDDAVNLVKNSPRPKALGTRHSFSRVADTAGDLICLADLNRVVHLDAKQETATVEAGITYGALCGYLHSHGWAVENLPSLPHVSVGGAIATGTHGSGTGNLATAVVGLEMVKANGDVIELAPARDERFEGMVVALGLLGVVTKVTLKVRKAFQIQQDVFEQIPLQALTEDFDRVTSSAYSVSLFTDWNSDRVNQVWFKREVVGPAAPALPFAFLSGRRAKVKRHPIAAVPADNCTEQGAPGPAHERLPHFRPDRKPSGAGDELQSEYFVNRADAPAALRAIAGIGPLLHEFLMISELRTINADTLWLSPCYKRPSVGIHFTWKPQETHVRPLLKLIENALEPFQARPHWGKLFELEPAAVHSRYDMLQSFRDLCREFDPDGKFRNPFADRYIF